MSARSEVRKKLVEDASRDDLAEALRLACAMLDPDRDDPNDLPAEMLALCRALVEHGAEPR